MSTLILYNTAVIERGSKESQKEYNMKMYTKEEIFSGNVENLENYKVNLFCYIKKYLLEFNEMKTLEQKAQEIYDSEDDISAFLEEGERRFNLLQEIGLKKLIDGHYVRRYIREHQSEFDFTKVSKTETTSNIAKILSLLLEELSYCFLEPAFDKESIDFLVDTLNEKEEMYELFEMFIKKSRDSSYSSKMASIEYMNSFCKLYFMNFADILFNIIHGTDNTDKLAYIRSLFNMTNSEVINEYDKIKKNAIDVLKDSEKLLEEQLQQEEDEEIGDEKTAQHYLKNSPHYHLVEEHKKKLTNFFETYFTINKKYDEDDFLDYANSVLVLLFIRTKELEFADQVPGIRMRLMCYFKENVVKYIDSLYADKEDQDAIKFSTNFFSFEILQMISYYLLSPFYFSEEKQAAIIADFLKIFSQHDYCKTFYSFLEDLYKNNEPILYYSPTKKYHHFLLMSVLNFMDEEEVAKELRKLLRKHYPISKEKLNKTNYRQLKEVNNPDFYKNPKSLNLLNEFAVSFLLNYMTNAEFVAPHSALISVIKHELDDNFDSHLGLFYKETLEQMVSEIANNKSSKYLTQEERDFSKSITFIENLLTTLTYEDKLTIFKNLNKEYLNTLLVTSFYNTSYFYDSCNDLDNLFRRYLPRLVEVLGEYREFKDNDFYEVDAKKQYSILLQHCMAYVLIDEIQEANELIPKMSGFDVKKEKIDDSMKQMVKQIKVEKKNKKTEIVDLNINTALQKENSEMIKNYKNEVAGYKSELSKQSKELRKLEERIAELEEDKAELNKLRELMFSMQNSDGSYSGNDDVDLQALVKEHEIVVVGGHIKLLDKIKEKYPSIRLTYDSCTYPELLIHNATHVFFLNNFMNHGSYYRAMKIIKTYKNKKWGYMACTNLEKFEESLKYELLKD